MDKKIRKQLKTDYENLEIKPSADLWSKIEVGIDKEVNVAQKPTLQWWKYAAVVLLLISFGTYFYFENQVDHKKILTKESPKDKVEKVNIINKESHPKSENLVVKAIQNIDSKANLINKEEEKPKQLISVNPQNISEKNLPEMKIKQDETEENLPLKEIDDLPIQKQMIAERKKVNYTNAEQLLLGRELDKTRVEIKNHRQFGVLDASKIKIRRPHSLKIFGVKVFSDSTSAE